MCALPEIVEGPSSVSVAGTRAFYLDPKERGGSSEAFMLGREFARLCRPYDGSLDLARHRGLGEEVVGKGRGENQPFAGRVSFPGTVLMVYGPWNGRNSGSCWASCARPTSMR